jgi:hypothetical protein
MSLPLISEYGGVACTENVKLEPLLGYIRFGLVENLVNLAVRLSRLEVPLSKRN